MNHTDDQLKQRDVSDTPRTDAAAFGSNIKNQSDSDKEWPWSAIDRGWDFARQLERELAAVTVERDEATSEMERCRQAYDIACDERTQLRNELAAVAAERDALRADLCTFAVDMERELSLATATIANQHKLITDAEQRGEKKADEAWIARETQLMAERDALLAKEGK